MRRTAQRRTAAGYIALLVLLLPTALPATASSPSGDDVIVLDGATSAEGIAAGEEATFYAGELMTGDIFRGDIGDGKAKRFIDAPEGRMAVGMKADIRNELLFVAGGSKGKAYVYNTETGDAVREYDLAPGFINDVTLTPDGAWFTNSAAPELYFIPVSRGGKLGKADDVETLKVGGEAGEPLQPNQFGFNGIAAAAEDDDVLIVAHTQNRALYAVDRDTGESSRIKGPDLKFVDGILVKGDTVWAVQNMANKISRLELCDDLSSFTVEDVITSKHFDVPTTVARFGDTLAAVNAQFMRPASPHEVVLVPAWD